MKILNNHNIEIAGMTLVCQHCGAELQIEKSDKISLSDKHAQIARTLPYNYKGQKFLYIFNTIGDCYKITCASCGETIGFIKWGQYANEDAVLINPERYWVNQDDGAFYVVDIAQSIINHIYNDTRYSHEHVYECHGEQTDTITIDNHQVKVYGDSKDNIIKEINKHYPDVTTDNKFYQNGMWELKHVNNPISGEHSGYINMTTPPEKCRGGIYAYNVRKSKIYT